MSGGYALTAHRAEVLSAIQQGVWFPPGHAPMGYTAWIGPTHRRWVVLLCSCGNESRRDWHPLTESYMDLLLDAGRHLARHCTSVEFGEDCRECLCAEPSLG